MEELKQAIAERGVGIGTEIVKVDSFLNQRIDTGLLTRMGRFIADSFADERVDLILTVESSGIAIALTAAQAFGDIPVVFARKSQSRNVSPDVYTAQVYSFTRQVTNTIRVSRDYLPGGSRVLIVDDFLANGEAVLGMMDILQQASCTTVGVAIAIEKGFQPGGQKLRERGVRLLCLAIVDGIEDGRIILRND